MVRNVFMGFLLFIPLSLFSQYTISGSVTDSDNKPLAGATIIVAGTQQGVVADLKGDYTIKKLKRGEYQITASYLGYEPVTENVNVESDLTVNFVLSLSNIIAEEVLVVSTRAGERSPVAYTNVSKEEINRQNLAQDLPYLLSLTPSTVVTSDAGAGVGYTGFRIRGTDANRINVTVNGIPLNDAESHGVWWVNMPDFASSLENVQVQRGVGTSTNGAGAFGASVNMQTNTLRKDAYGEIASSFGSFNTYKNTIKLGTGLVNKHFAFDARLSKVTSDGFIDRASSELGSYFVSGGYYSDKTLVKLNVFSGKEKTYQAWWGVPKVRLENDLEGMLRYQDHYLYTQEETEHMINSNSRTYNYYTYDNETDNYQQDHYQLFFSQKIGGYININAAVHYTYGRGYYEQYRVDDDFASYNLPDIATPNDTISSTDLVRQKWLDNDFYGTTLSVNYKKDRVNAIIGGAWNQYDGRHFGKIIWAQYLGDVPKDYEWYRNKGLKTDFNIYGKLNYAITNAINAFGDVQYRKITHDMHGLDDDLRLIDQRHEFNFFNPKVGVMVRPNAHNEVFASVAIANREPNRSNFTDAAPNQDAPIPEKLTDFELGYAYKTSVYRIGANIYNMQYKDQLILTGEINDVGAAIMVNVDNSYRRGIEIYGGIKPVWYFKWDANATYSLNKIKGFTEYVDNWDTWGQEVNELGETDIAFSPNLIGTNQFIFTPLKNLEIALISQYVSEQFIDNTSSRDRMLDSYFINNVRLSYNINFQKVKSVEFTLLVNNLFSEEYETNAWVYSYMLGGERYAMDGYFPQAGINFLAGINIKF